MYIYHINIIDMNFNEYYTLQPLVDSRPQVGDEQYIGIRPYSDSAMAISRITYKLVYIIDYNRMNFLYVLEPPFIPLWRVLKLYDKEVVRFFTNMCQ